MIHEITVLLFELLLLLTSILILFLGALDFFLEYPGEVICVFVVVAYGADEGGIQGPLFLLPFLNLLLLTLQFGLNIYHLKLNFTEFYGLNIFFSNIYGNAYIYLILTRI